MAMQRPTGNGPALSEKQSDNKKGRPEPPWFCPPQRYSAMKMPPHRVRLRGKRKQKQGGDIPPCYLLRLL